MRRLLPLILLLTTVAPVKGAAPPPALQETFDIRYYPGKGPQTLDVFAPWGAGTYSRPPVVLFVHGGTWMAGDKDFHGVYRGVGRYLARHGLVAVMINYRLSPLFRHPAHARDVARAYAWTRRNIARYGGDPDRIILAGHSAGAHLASLVATDETYLKDPALHLTDRDRAALRGVASLSGVYRIPGPAEFRTMAAGIVDALVYRSGRESAVRKLTPLLMAVGTRFNPFTLVFGSDPVVRRNASPLAHVHKGLPPFLVLTAEAEVPGLKRMAEDFTAALRKAGDSVEARQIARTTHQSIAGAMPSGRTEAGKVLLDFIHRCTREARQ